MEDIFKTRTFEEWKAKTIAELIHIKEAYRDELKHHIDYLIIKLSYAHLHQLADILYSMHLVERAGVKEINKLIPSMEEISKMFSKE